MSDESRPEPRPTPAAPVPSTPAPPPPTRCPSCREVISPADAFCRFCGARQQVTDPFYYHPICILVLAFLFLGPFALALVWRAKAMSATTRTILSAIILAYSAITFYFAYVLCAALYEHFSLLNQVM